MSTFSATRNVSTRRNRNYANNFKWTDEFNGAVLKFYEEARSRNTKGYMNLLKELWDKAYPALKNINKRALRERAAFLHRKLNSNTALPETANQASEEITPQTSNRTQPALSVTRPSTIPMRCSTIVSPDNHLAPPLLDELRIRFTRFIELFRMRRCTNGPTTPIFRKDFRKIPSMP